MGGADDRAPPIERQSFSAMNFKISADWRLISVVDLVSPCASAWMARATASSRRARTASSRVNAPLLISARKSATVALMAAIVYAASWKEFIARFLADRWRLQKTSFIAPCPISHRDRGVGPLRFRWVEGRIELPRHLDDTYVASVFPMQQFDVESVVRTIKRLFDRSTVQIMIMGHS
jgi:hypothetical protein